MGTLYELTSEFEYLKMLLESGEIDEDIFNDTIAGIDCEIEAKADGYAKIRASINSDISALKEEESRLKNRRIALEKNVARLESALEHAMRATEKTKFKTPLFSFNIAKNPPKVVIDDETKIPKKYLIAQPPKIDKDKLKEVLKTQTLTFARLESGESLRIR